jgi:DNA topoisomerase I
MHRSGGFPREEPQMSITDQDVVSRKAPLSAKRGLAAVQKLTRKFGLRVGEQRELTIRRLKRGSRFKFVTGDGRIIKDAATLSRLKSLAVPPAYGEVRYAQKPNAHLQATGRDAAGRLQYRYHPDWEKVREARKARRLLRLVAVLPKIRRSVGQRLTSNQPDREFALSAVIELVARTAIRPGNDSYAKLHGSRGATTLLKSNAMIDGNCVVLSFRAKGGKAVQKACVAKSLARAFELLRTLPGRRLFQYRDEAGEVRVVNSAQVNAFLREIAGARISLKDFRTLMASVEVMARLASVKRARSARARNKQIMEAVRASADGLANTPAICRKSYVHETVVTAFESGVLERFSSKLKGCRSQARREGVLAEILALAADGK